MDAPHYNGPPDPFPGPYDPWEEVDYWEERWEEAQMEAALGEDPPTPTDVDLEGE